MEILGHYEIVSNNTAFCFQFLLDFLPTFITYVEFEVLVLRFIPGAKTLSQISRNKSHLLLQVNFCSWT